MATLIKGGETITVPDEAAQDYLDQGWTTPAGEKEKAARRAKRRAAAARRAAKKR